ncbi:exonuclease domain-containing protein [Neisseria sp. S1]|uniref:3'-5' exonuclease family protein n=1 Tax=Neisseria sp. S1 TaxID=3318354 RepID=UPI003A836EBB
MLSACKWPLLGDFSKKIGLPVAIIDLESTGGDMYQDRITEIAILRFNKGKISRYEWLVNPQKNIPPFITSLTGISNEMVADAPHFADLVHDLLPLLRGTLLIAHNSRFDYTFLRHEFQRAGIHFASPALCSVQLSRKLYPQYFKHNLDSIIERFGIQTESRHRAMTDVTALADFLEISLKEKGCDEWLKHVHTLTNPHPLPHLFSEQLANEIYKLSDSHGVIVWLDAENRAISLSVHKKAFSEVSALLRRNSYPSEIRNAEKIIFHEALGSLHALQKRVELQKHYQLPASQTTQTFFSVEFAYDEKQRLRAHIRNLENGSYNNPPNGLFLHKKKAKQILSEWAQQQQLCPDSLGLLPTTYPAGQPCPKIVAGQCNGGCQHQNGIERQNEIITASGRLLPVADWGNAHALEITETDMLSKRSVTIRCINGTLNLPDGSYYFDSSLPAIVKDIWKRSKHNIRILY